MNAHLCVSLRLTVSLICKCSPAWLLLLQFPLFLLSFSHFLNILACFFRSLSLTLSLSTTWSTRSISPPADPPLSHQHPGADECVASYWSRWVMDDGWEMSDGVQAKVPIRGQPEGGVSPTVANGRRLGEMGRCGNRSAPRPLNPKHTWFCVSALLCIFFPHMYGSHLFRPVWDRHCIQLCVCACMFL